LEIDKEKQWWQKWDNAAACFDFMNRGVELRFGEDKEKCFSQAEGLTLLVAVGTGLDLPYFSDSHNLVGIDISEKMLEKAKEKLEGRIHTHLTRTDVHNLPFPDETFDTVVTSCTFCSVPDPVRGLKELNRVLKKGSSILMFEHVRSDIFWMGPMMDIMTKASRHFGPDLNRRTKDNVIKAGFKLTREVNLYLDMVKLFEGVK